MNEARVLLSRFKQEVWDSFINTPKSQYLSTVHPSSKYSLSPIHEFRHLICDGKSNITHNFLLNFNQKLERY